MLQHFKIIRYVKTCSIYYVSKNPDKMGHLLVVFFFKPEAPQRRETTEFLDEKNTPPMSVF